MEWDEFFQGHLKLVKKLEEMLESGDNKQKGQAILAYVKMKEELKNSYEKLLKHEGSNADHNLDESGGEVLSADHQKIMDKRMKAWNNSLKKLNQLIEKNIG